MQGFFFLTVIRSLRCKCFYQDNELQEKSWFQKNGELCEPLTIFQIVITLTKEKEWVIPTISPDIKWGQEGTMSRTRILITLPLSIPML